MNYRELAMALSYGRNGGLPATKVSELSNIEDAIAGADSDIKVVNFVRLWAAKATTEER